MNDVRVLRAHLMARVGSLVIDAQLDTSPGTLVIVGPNGAGKTSLLSLLLGVLPVERGRIEVGGALLLDTATSIDVPPEHRRMGYVRPASRFVEGLVASAAEGDRVDPRGRVE